MHAIHINRSQLILALGDALIFIFFAAEGRATHDMPLGPSPVLTVASVAAPFAIPWFILASLPRSIILQRPMLPLFAVAALGINGAMLTSWRLIASLVEVYLRRSSAR